MSLARSDRGNLPPFIVMDVVREANRLAHEGRDVLHLEVGQPSAGAPSRVIEAAQALLRTGPGGYTDALGIPALRQRIALHYREIYAIDLDPASVAITVGASGGFLLAFLACFNPGDRVAMAAPGYPSYRHILTALGVEVVLLETNAADRFQPTPNLLDRIEGPLHGLVIASPANPTGTMLHAGDIEALTAWCRARDVRLVSDEIYHGITYADPAVSMLAATRDGVIVNSFSKYFAMTGWRLGWLVVPDDLIRSVECIAQNFVISPPTLAQHAAIEAFDCRDELDGHVTTYRHNRDLLLTRLPRAGFSCLAEPEGAFFLYADVSGRTDDSLGFCRRILEETGVAITPGVDFDPVRGGSMVRFSFAGATADIDEALRRLERLADRRF